MVEGAGSDDYRLVKTDALRAARPDAPDPGDQRRRRGALPERADRRRRAGGDGLRQLGRRARRRRVPDASASPTRRRVLRQLQARRTTAGACRTSSSPRAAGPWLEAIARLRRRRRRRRLDRRPRRGARAHRRSGVALQGNLDPSVLFAGADAIRGEVAALLASFGAAASADGAQTATSSTSATASASTRRPSMLRCWSTRCTSCRAPYHARAKRDRKSRSAAYVPNMQVSEHSGLDLSP